MRIPSGGLEMMNEAVASCSLQNSPNIYDELYHLFPLLVWYLNHQPASKQERCYHGNMTHQHHHDLQD